MNGTLFVEASRKRSESFLTKDVARRRGCDVQITLRQGSADVLDRVVDLAQGDDLLADGIVGANAGGAARRDSEEEVARVGVVTELMAQHAEGSGRVAEVARSHRRGASLEEEGPKRLVLALSRTGGDTEEIGRIC